MTQIYHQETAEAHKTGRFHFHDLGFLSVYCVVWNMEDLLISGFRGEEAKTQIKPTKDLRTVLGQVVNFFYAIQGEAAGA